MRRTLHPSLAGAPVRPREPTCDDAAAAPKGPLSGDTVTPPRKAHRCEKPVGGGGGPLTQQQPQLHAKHDGGAQLAVDDEDAAFPPSGANFDAVTPVGSAPPASAAPPAGGAACLRDPAGPTRWLFRDPGWRFDAYGHVVASDAFVGCRHVHPRFELWPP